jgi:DTW domain-containing protein YfiP
MSNENTSPNAQNEPRLVCAVCARPQVACYCAAVTRFATRTNVLIVQHPRERDVPINTARIAKLALERCSIVNAVEADDHPLVQSLLARAANGDAVGLLFPGENTGQLQTLSAGTNPTLVVVDGTWWQAAKILKRSPKLAGLPKYALAPAEPSRYRIRKEPAFECLSTIEAITDALVELEPRGTIDPSAILRPFETMVELQIAFAREGKGRGRHTPKAAKKVRSPVLPEAFVQQPQSLVLAYGEANAWPWETPNRPQAEVIHWVAERVSDGARKSWVIAPRAGLAPNTAMHSRLAKETILTGVSWDHFVREWREFVPPNSTLCTWNTFAVDLLHRECEQRAEPALWQHWIDVHPAIARMYCEKIGTLEQCAARFGSAPTPWTEGRAGVRISLISQVVRAMLAIAETQRAARSVIAASA